MATMLLQLIPLALLLPRAHAHGRITDIVVPSSNSSYAGWDPEYALPSHPQPPPPLAAWSAQNLGNIFVAPSSFNHSNITCHLGATPGALHVNVSAGDTIQLKWNEWPTSHVGPILTYMASCNASSCAAVNKDALKFVKIDQQGWLNSSGWETDGLGGTWATDVLIKNRFWWTVKVPADIDDGAYVLRHEIIALHVADEVDGAQAYPQCVNLRVTSACAGAAEKMGQGKKKMEGGVDGRRLYRPDDKGIRVDVHKKLTGYNIPGPTVWSGAAVIKQPNEKKMAI